MNCGKQKIKRKVRVKRKAKLSDTDLLNWLEAQCKDNGWKWKVSFEGGNCDCVFLSENTLPGFRTAIETYGYRLVEKVRGSEQKREINTIKNQIKT